jgi:hypothetical protein
MIQLLSIRAFLVLWTRAIAVSKKLSPTTWKLLTALQCGLLILSVWGFYTSRYPAPVENSSIEANKTFQVQLSAAAGGAMLGPPSVATVTVVDDDPAVAGRWGEVMPWPVVPIHEVLLPNGKILLWDRHNITFGWDGDPRLWDPAAPNVFPTPPAPGWDLFCAGHTLTADGRSFVAGGHIADGVGDLKAGTYDPSTNSWAQVPNMNAGRWYPTAVILAGGDILVLAGTRNGYLDTNPLPQVWLAKSGTWRNLTDALLSPYPTWADLSNSSMGYREYGSSVMLDDGRVLIVGGNPRGLDPSATPTILPSPTAEVINPNDAAPAWRLTAPMSVGARHLNTTILPDGKVLVTGRSSAPGFDEPAGAVLYAELWNPATETWTLGAAGARYRGYHSNALLLPNGRVLVSGGGHSNPAGGTEQNNAEIYSPPYLFKGSRPVISGAPAVVTYGQTFSVQTPDAANITRRPPVYNMTLSGHRYSSHVAVVLVPDISGSNPIHVRYGHLRYLNPVDSTSTRLSLESKLTSGGLSIASATKPLLYAEALRARTLWSAMTILKDRRFAFREYNVFRDGVFPDPGKYFEPARYVPVQQPQSPSSDYKTLLMFWFSLFSLITNTGGVISTGIATWISLHMQCAEQIRKQAEFLAAQRALQLELEKRQLEIERLRFEVEKMRREAPQKQPLIVLASS